MKRPILVALVSLAVLAVISAWAFEQWSARRHFENLLNAEYQRSFFDTVLNVRSLEVLLGKALVGDGGPQDAGLLGETWQEAVLAQRDLSRLPVQPAVIGRTSQFLNQVGEFTNLLMRQTAAGRPPSPDQWNTLEELHRQAGILNTQLQAVQRRVEADGARYWEIAPELRAHRGALRPAPPDPANNELETVNREMEQFPTLVYDGAFSEHMDRRVPRAATGAPTSETEARERALAVVDRPRTQLAARVTGTTKGRIPSYRVEVTERNGRNGDRFLVDVARRGGEVVWMLDTRTPGTPTVSVAEARRRAQAYLNRLGRPDMEAVSSEQQGRGTVLFTFAPRQEGVLLYTDMIKVTVALDEGRVSGLNAIDYVMYHQPRELPAPAISAAAARRGLNPDFAVRSARLVLIPTTGGGEALAWELRGERVGNQYLVYVNAEDGRREKILQVVETEDGTLTI
ncbi:MAG: germination protein YpeB [Bacillota bacterium]